MHGWFGMVAAALLLQATYPHDGAIHHTGVALVSIAAVLAFAGAWVRWPDALEADARRLLPSSLLLLLAWNLARLALRWPMSPFTRRTADFPQAWFWAGLGATCIIAASYFVRGLVQPRLRLPLLGAVYAALALLVIHWSPQPFIDVWHFEQRAAGALLGGRNPYAMQYPNIYGNTAFFGPELVTATGVHSHTYPPLSILATIPGYVLGDVRYALVFATLAAAALVALTSRSLGLPVGGRHELALACALFTPRAFFAIEQSWSEPFVAAAAAACLWAVVRSRGVALALAALVSMKQYGALLVPLLWSTRAVRTRQLLVAGLLSGAVALPFLVWDANAFLNGVVRYQFRLSFRPDALSLAPLWWHATGTAPPMWLGVACGIGAAAALTWRLRSNPEPDPAEVSVACAATLLAVFLFHKQAFFNYYWLASFLLLTGAALTPVEAPATAPASAEKALPATT